MHVCLPRLYKRPCLLCPTQSASGFGRRWPESDQSPKNGLLLNSPASAEALPFPSFPIPRHKVHRLESIPFHRRGSRRRTAFAHGLPQCVSAAARADAAVRYVVALVSLLVALVVFWFNVDADDDARKKKVRAWNAAQALVSGRAGTPLERRGSGRLTPLVLLAFRFTFSISSRGGSVLFPSIASRSKLVH